MLQSKDLRVTDWIVKQQLTICCLQETHFRVKDTHILKVRGQERFMYRVIKDHNCQSTPEEKKKQNRRQTLPDFVKESTDTLIVTILRSYSDQNSVVLGQKQTYWSMEHNREPRNKTTHTVN